MEKILESPQEVFISGQAYPEYLEMLNELLAQNKTTGPNQSEQYIAYARQNLQRKKRATRTLRISEEQIAFFQNLSRSYQWLVITEGWCGDAAVILPVLNHLAERSDQIELHTVLRDEHPELMDQFLTKGARSIPILVIIDSETGEVVGKWGPRPAFAQEIMTSMKQEEVPFAEISAALQKWYAKDKGVTIIKEVQELMQVVDMA